MQTKQMEWLDKAQAAEVLGMSPRSLLAMAASGKIQSKRERDERTKQMAVKLHAGDVERIRYEREHPPEAAAQAAQGEKPQALQPSQPSRELPSDVRDFAYLLGTILKARAEAPPAELKEPHFLTLKQARDVSGLPISFLHQKLCKTGIATKTGGGWRIARPELERFARTSGHVGQVSELSMRTSASS
jgi:hypothetical protein